SLVQHDTAPWGGSDGNFIVPSETAIQTDRLQIIIDRREQSCFCHFKLYLLAKFSTQGGDLVLPVVDPTAEKTPMARVPYIRKVIAQLHDVATVFEDEQRCDRMAR